ncbi:TlpA family protein disulfide reductase [Glaciecola sp. 1036]|uniref:TlpA family protein disulfide reductase n=1 Tax=Alteromonadaceae TaxID=72275 RepID=UPI003D02CEF4
MKSRALLFFVGIVALSTGFFIYSTQAYDFRTLDNKKYSFDDFTGDYVIVNYFAEWCAPCLKEVPELVLFQNQKQSDVHLFAVSYDTLSEQKLSSIKQKYNMAFPLVAEVKTAFPFEKPQYLPATFVIRPDGSVAGKLFGEQTAQSLIDSINQDKAIYSNAE